MKKLFYSLFAILAIVACSGNDVENGGTGGGQTPPKQPQITLNATAADFTTEGGSNTITFTSTDAWTAQVVNNRADDWCWIEPTSGPAGNAQITVTTTANDTPDERTASVIIKAGTASKTVKVSQKQKDALTVTSSKFEVGAEGGEVVVEVKANIDFEYTIDEAAKEWIQYEGTRAMKTSTLKFAIAQNEDTEKREGKITIKSGEFNEVVTIYQAGDEPTIVISKNEYIVASAGETIAVEVKSNVDVEVEIPSDAGWISENTTRGVSTNTYYFDIDENVDYDQRSAEIKFTNKANNLSEVVTVVQSQKDAIVLAKSEYEFGSEGGDLNFEIQTNVDITVTISDNAQDWIKQVETRALETKTLYFNISTCSTKEDREGTITISGGNATQTITVKQSGVQEILEKEREVLIAFYEATGGDNWTRNDNWCSDKPVGEWYGVSVNEKGTVDRIRLGNNNLTGTLLDVDFSKLADLVVLFLNDNEISGTIPTVLGELSRIIQLDLGWNQLIGTIPTELGQLSTLQTLTLAGNELSGSIPAELGQLSNLTDLYLQFNESSHLSGTIPAELGQLTKLENLNLSGNEFTGSIPAELGNLLNLRNLHLQYNQLSGSIPPELGGLSNLEELSLNDNLLTGSIPAELGQLSKLKYIQANDNKFSGSIPVELRQLSNLKELFLQENELSGSIPAELGALKNLEILWLNDNYLTGVVPDSVMELDCWDDNWYHMLLQKGDGISQEGLKIYAPTFSIQTLGGGVISNDIISEHKYTVLYNFFEWCPYSEIFTPTLIALYDKYKDSGLGVFSTTTDEEALVRAYINNQGIEWPCTIQQDFISSPFAPFLTSSPNVAVYDQNGLIVFNGVLTNYTELPSFLAELFDDGSSATYESTDYSKDGEVKQLQTATKGDGIDIVLMGDAYSDRLIADGSYEDDMRTAMEQFFAVEPYKSFRDHFNVYSVTAVSANETYAESSSTVFEGYFGEGTHVGGNDEKVFTYAQKAISADRIEDALIVVMMNSTSYAGTCYMYYPTKGDWGDGTSISYFPVGADAEALGRVLHHEAGGHGFSKLGDEYAYEYMGGIPGSEIDAAQMLGEYGWYKNVDFTSDPTQVKWYHFLSDNRYANEGLGVYEGAYTYWSGAYRPTYNSIMNANIGGFNAPSREAIYYRIHKLAYGEAWQYDYEEFVEWDARNRATASSTRGIPYRLNIPDDFKPLHPPVVIKKSWRNAKNNTPVKPASLSTGREAGSSLRKTVQHRTTNDNKSVKYLEYHMHNWRD